MVVPKDSINMKRRPRVLYHNKIVYLLDKTMIRNAAVSEQDVIVFTGEGDFARADGGWERIEPAVYEKIVPRSEVTFLDTPNG